GWVADDWADADEDVSRCGREERVGDWGSRAVCGDFGCAIYRDGSGRIVIQVLQPGMLTTVQDLGREGFGPMGVSPSGAADAVSLRVGNLLAGNVPSAAGLEMTLVGGTFLFPEGATVVLAGADFGATLDDVAVGTWTAVLVRSGQTLQVGATRGGARCYLCVRG